MNANAGRGKLRVGGRWNSSNPAAGVIAGADGIFGTQDDALMSSNTPIIAKIVSVLIKGAISRTEGEDDYFGFVAEQIGASEAAGIKLALNPGPRNDLSGLPAGLSGNLRVREAV